MKTKPELDALTDQAIAHIAAQRACPDPMIRAHLPMARGLAEMLRTMFPEDAPLAGRVAVASSQALSQIIRELQGVMRADSIGPVAANLLAFAGEQLTREAPDGAT